MKIGTGNSVSDLKGDGYNDFIISTPGSLSSTGAVSVLFTSELNPNSHTVSSQHLTDRIRIGNINLELYTYNDASELPYKIQLCDIGKNTSIPGCGMLLNKDQLESIRELLIDSKKKNKLIEHIRSLGGESAIAIADKMESASAKFSYANTNTPAHFSVVRSEAASTVPSQRSILMPGLD